MKAIYTIVALAAIAAPAAAQRKVTLQVSYAENTASSSAAFVTKAWTDSVNVYFNTELAQHGPNNLVRVNESRGISSDVRLLLAALPLMAGDKPSGITAYSIIVFRAPALGSSWQYVNSEIGYTRNPAEAAAEMVKFTSAALGAR